MFMIRWKNIKIPQWVIHLLLVVNMGFYVMIATVDYHHLYYKDYWLAPSKANLNGYTLEISPAPMYYVYMAFLLAEIMTTIGSSSLPTALREVCPIKEKSISL